MNTNKTLRCAVVLCIAVTLQVNLYSQGSSLTQNQIECQAMLGLFSASQSQSEATTGETRGRLNALGGGLGISFPASDKVALRANLLYQPSGSTYESNTAGSSFSGSICKYYLMLNALGSYNFFMNSYIMARLVGGLGVGTFLSGSSTNKYEYMGIKEENTSKIESKDVRSPDVRLLLGVEAGYPLSKGLSLFGMIQYEHGLTNIVPDVSGAPQNITIKNNSIGLTFGARQTF